MRFWCSTGEVDKIEEGGGRERENGPSVRMMRVRSPGTAPRDPPEEGEAATVSKSGATHSTTPDVAREKRPSGGRRVFEEWIS